MDFAKHEMHFDFQFPLKEQDDPQAFAKLITNADAGIRFAHRLLGVDPMLSSFSFNLVDSLFIAQWQRDMETIVEKEIDILHELLIDFCEEMDVNLDAAFLEGDQFFHFEEIYDNLFHRVHSVKSTHAFRAYRDMGTIYVHRITDSAGSA